MSDAFRQALVADLAPVRRIGSPWVRAIAWIGLVAATAAVLAAFADLPVIVHRLMIVPDMWMAELGAALTAALAAFATFQLAMPDRSPTWAALPLPGLALWIGASGMGCARTWLIPGTQDASMAESMHCLRWIVSFSVPLSIAIFWLLRRGYTLYPTLTGAAAGLSAASASAALLVFFHPFDASLSDLLVHGGAVALIVLVNRVLGGRLFGRRALPRRS